MRYDVKYDNTSVLFFYRFSEMVDRLVYTGGRPLGFRFSVGEQRNVGIFRARIEV